MQSISEISTAHHQSKKGRSKCLAARYLRSQSSKDRIEACESHPYRCSHLPRSLITGTLQVNAFTLDFLSARSNNRRIILQELLTHDSFTGKSSEIHSICSVENPSHNIHFIIMGTLQIQARYAAMYNPVGISDSWVIESLPAAVAYDGFSRDFLRFRKGRISPPDLERLPADHQNPSR
ncbi:hypothetical protein ABKN59_011246 [Abortiporus biennis]